MDFISVADLALFMQVAEADLTTGLADLAVSAAQATVRGYLGQQITLVTSDDIFLDGTGTKKLRLPQRPVVSVSSVTEWDDVLVDPDDYEFQEPQWLVRRDHRVWHPGVRNIEVVYTHGWQTADLDSDTTDSDFDSNHVPADISLVTLILARRFYDRSLAGEQGVIKSETIGQYSYTLESAAGSELLPAEKAVLDAYIIQGAG